MVGLDDVRVELRRSTHHTAGRRRKRKEQVDADREVGRVNERTLQIENGLRHSLQLIGPTGRAGDDGIPCASGGQDVRRALRRAR